MKYFPDKLPVGRLPDREYFWNVFNTLYTDYVTELVAHANKVRCEASTEHQAAQVIEIADEIWDELHAAPFAIPPATVFGLRGNAKRDFVFSSVCPEIVHSS